MSSILLTQFNLLMFKCGGGACEIEIKGKYEIIKCKSKKRIDQAIEFAKEYGLHYYYFDKKDQPSSRARVRHLIVSMEEIDTVELDV